MRKLSVDELNRLNIDLFKKVDKLNAIVILDNIRSQFNVGSIFRTCDAFRIKELLLCGITATPPAREIEKSALGATKSVEWKYFKETIDAVIYCKQNDYKIIAIEQTNVSVDIRKFVYNPYAKYTFIFGNEVNGISQNVLDISDFSIEIPQFGTKHSFNVAVTSAIVLYDFFIKGNFF